MLYSLLSLTLFVVGSFGQVPPDPTPGSTAGTEAPVASAAPVVPATIQASAGTTQAPGTTAGSSASTTANRGTPAPVATLSPVPLTPANPPANPGTGTGATPGTGTTQQPPVTGQQPPATPQYGPPQQQQPPFNPYMNPGFGAGILDPQTLKCEFGQCRNRRITMTPGQGFKLECNMMRQCDNLDLTLNIGADPQNFGNLVNEINDFIFDAPQSGVKLTLNNPMMQQVEVNNILCKRTGSCQGMTVTAGFGVELWEINVKCEMPGACTGCTINGQSCEMISMMTGNHHGGVAPGFGYNNVANVPGAGGVAPAPQTGFGGAPAPQQPQYPQQPVPQQPQYQQPQYPQYQQPQYPQYNPYQQYNPYNAYNYWMWSQI